ncbi:MAG: ABC transporter permease [Dysosmobacter sp.]
MNFTQSFKLALKSLKTSKMRAFLTMLGIIIGVGAVIVILSLGNGMTNMMNSQFEKMGSNLIQVMTYGRGTGGTRDVDVEDLYELVDKYPQYLTGVTPYVSASAKVRYQADDYDRTSVYGVSEAFFKEDTKGTMQGETLGRGPLSQLYRRQPQPERVRHRQLIWRRTAFRGDALGKTISLSGVPYTVVGVLSKSGDSSEGSADDVIYIPYENAQRMGTGTMMMGTGEMFLLTSTSRDTASAAKGIVEKRLYKTYQSSDYYMVMTSAEMMDAMNTMMNTMMIVLVAIAAISLLVGGIGIMNIMLVSVTERTREIGIRKSLGAKQKDIRGQFVIEAGTTSAVGGVLGIVFGLLLARAATIAVGAIMSSSMNGITFSAVPTLSDIAVSFGVSVGIGVLFGYLPANKAAKLNPIDALRYD